MGGLVLKLSPNERVLVNGAVIENGDRRSRIRILSEDVRILRLKDALHPEEVDTPVKRVCYTIQLALSGDVPNHIAMREALDGIDKLKRVFRDGDSRKLLSDASLFLTDLKLYAGFKVLKKLLSKEATLLMEK